MWLGAMVLSQALMLVVPVKITEKRLKSRRPLLVPVIVSGLLFALLLVAFVWSVMVAVWGDDGPPPLRDRGERYSPTLGLERM